MSNLDMTTREAQAYKDDLTLQLTSEREQYFRHKLMDQKPSSQPTYDRAITEVSGHIEAIAPMAPADVIVYALNELGADD